MSDADLQALDAFVASAPVAIVSGTYCPFCTKVKNLLRPLAGEANVKVYEIDKEPSGEGLQAAVAKRYQHDTIPAVFVKGEFKGGFTDVDAAVKSGALTF